MNQKFPPPENPYLPAAHQDLEVEGAMVYQVTTLPRGFVACSAVVSQGGSDTLMRFCLPRHNRAVRRIFVRAGLREVPRTVETFNIEGMVALNLSGTVIGEDNLREDLETMPVAALVLARVKVRELQ